MWLSHFERHIPLIDFCGRAQLHFGWSEFKKNVLCLQCLLGRLSVASGELEFNLLMQRLKSLNFDILNFIILLRIRNLGF